MSQRILVVDDDTEIVRLLRAYLEQAGYRVFVAYTGSEAMRAVRSERPDLILLDVMMPERDGWEVTRIVRADPNLASTPIIILTARVADEDKVVGLELGADDYVTKPFNPREVVARVRAVLRRAQGEAVAPKVVETGPLRVDFDRQQVHVEGRPVRLTPAEFGLLQALVKQPDRPLTRLELIELGLGYDYEGLERTVDSHIKNLRQKLDQAGGGGLGTALVETVFGVGYRLRSQPDWVGESSE
jgi:two-component system alkaline phosphatase synthesis response regulator PhoP